jgi:hypothetical protein
MTWTALVALALITQAESDTSPREQPLALGRLVGAKSAARVRGGVWFGNLSPGPIPITETVHLMGSDALEGFGRPFARGTDLHISLVAEDKAEADRAFEALSSGGKVEMPIANAPWGPYFGMCEDRFGVKWMVSLAGPG